LIKRYSFSSKNTRKGGDHGSKEEAFPGTPCYRDRGLLPENIFIACVFMRVTE
jgi:hypothetical protein